MNAFINAFLATPHQNLTTRCVDVMSGIHTMVFQICIKKLLRYGTIKVKFASYSL